MSQLTAMSLTNQVIWITGASSGLGEEFCYQLDRLGATLIISARRKNLLEKVNKQLPNNPGSAKVLELDLEDLHSIDQKVEEALSYYGRIDCLINNAGVAIRDYAMSTKLEVDQKLMNINYFGPIELTRHVLPSMIERKSGQVVVISSLSGKYGVPRLAAYSAPKHALHGFFESLRSELINKGIKFTIIIPGIIKTDITAHAVVGEGTSFGKVERTFKTAYPVEKAVKKMIKAIEKQKEEAYVGGMEGITLLLNRLSPYLLRRLIRNHPIKMIRQLKQRISFWKKEKG